MPRFQVLGSRFQRFRFQRFGIGFQRLGGVHRTGGSRSCATCRPGMYDLSAQHIRPVGPARNVPAPPRRVASTRLWPAALNAEETEERRRGGFATEPPSRNEIIVRDKVKVMGTNQTMIFPGPRLTYEKADVGTKREGRACRGRSHKTVGPIVRSRTRICVIRDKSLPAISTTEHTEAASRHTENTESRRPYIPNTSVCSVTAVGRSACSVTYTPSSPHPHLSSASPLLRFLRVEQKQSHLLQEVRQRNLVILRHEDCNMKQGTAVAQERDPPGCRAPQRHAPRAARVHCVPIPHRSVPFLSDLCPFFTLMYPLYPCRIYPYCSDYAHIVPKRNRTFHQHIDQADGNSRMRLLCVGNQRVGKPSIFSHPLIPSFLILFRIGC